MSFLKEIIKNMSTKKQDIYPFSAPYFKKGTERRQCVITQSIYRYFISLHVMKTTNDYMQKHRRLKTECFVFWGGYLINNDTAQIVSIYYPKIITTYGRIYLSNKDVTLLNRSLLKHDHLLLVELHTHPPNARGQNSVDASNALCYHQGFISIVVPDFGYPIFYDLRKCYIYEYKNKGLWKQLSFKEIEERFIIEDSVIEVVEK